MGKITLRRYTNLAATIDILHRKVITLLSPDLWDDRNDAYYLGQYKTNKSAGSVLALCFAEAPETYHHWKVFSSGMDGVCLEFNKDEFLSRLPNDGSLQSRSVIYKKIEEIGSGELDLEELPFLKRYPYRDEKEFRLLYVDNDEELSVKDFPIELQCIDRVTLSPWMPQVLKDSVSKTLHSIEGCRSLDIFRSTLVQSERWMRKVDHLREPNHLQ